MKRFQFLTGFLCGALLFAGLTSVASAAPGIMAILSNQPVYVDGRQASMTAYQINGNNYIKLRDVGEAVGFNVYWDGHSVQIESKQPYTGMAPANQAVPSTLQPSAAPATLTEETVYATIRALRDIYPSNTPYGAPYRSASNGPYGAAPTNCAGWATLCSDTAFGNLPWRRVDRPNWAQIRPGDLIEYKDESAYHVVVVLEKTEDYVKTTESGITNKARWGGKYYKWWLEEHPTYILYTRYPE